MVIIVNFFLNLIYPERFSLSVSPGNIWHTASEPIEQTTALDIHIESLFYYRNPKITSAIWQLKYKGSKKVANVFAQILHDVLIDKIYNESLFENFEDVLLIPLPISKERKKERGWNQTELVAIELKKLENKYKLKNFEININILEKIKHTLPQTKLNKSQRLENLRGCYAVRKNMQEFIKNKNIILFDDVTTTGSTLYEAKEALLKAGARSVVAVTIAH